MESKIYKFKPTIFSFVGELLFIGLGCLGFYQYYYGHSVGDQRMFLASIFPCLFGMLLALNTKVFKVDLAAHHVIVYSLFRPKGKKVNFEELKKILIQKRRSNIASSRGLGPDSQQFTLYFKRDKKVTISRIFNTGDFDAVIGYLRRNYSEIVTGF